MSVSVLSLIFTEYFKAKYSHLRVLDTVGFLDTLRGQLHQIYNVPSPKICVSPPLSTPSTPENLCQYDSCSNQEKPNNGENYLILELATFV